MSIEMTFEIDGQLTSNLAQQILQINGFLEYDQLEDGFSVFHPTCGLNVYFLEKTEPCSVLAEGLITPSWKCKSRMIFRYSDGDNYDACEFVTMSCSRTLAAQSSAFFVLSFQYESVYAIRDDKGYREIPDTSATMRRPVE